MTSTLRLTDKDNKQPIYITFAMKKILIQIIRAVKALWHHGKFVIVDGRDNTITISKRLYRDMTSSMRTDFRIYTFAVGNTYAFCFLDADPSLTEQHAPFELLQISAVHNTIGFHSDIVSCILHKIGLPYDAICTISVIPKVSKAGIRYYELQCPGCS